MEIGRAGWCGESSSQGAPSRIRIAGSGVIDRPTFRIPGSQMRAWSLGLGRADSPSRR